MKIINGEKSDLKEILDLQYLAFEDEAKIVDDYSIEPLHQSLEDSEKEFDKGTVLKAINDDNVIIGSVRNYIQDNTSYIGRLMVHPDYRGNGLGSRLIEEIEKIGDKSRFEVFTSSKSERNLNLYRKHGYKKFDERIFSSKLKFIYLEKFI